jgi:hypothetical protein
MRSPCPKQLLSSITLWSLVNFYCLTCLLPAVVGTKLPLPGHELVWYKAMAFLATYLGGGCLFEATTTSDSFTYNWSKLDLKVFHKLFFFKEICLSEEEVLAMAADHEYFQMYLSLA